MSKRAGLEDQQVSADKPNISIDVDHMPLPKTPEEAEEMKQAIKNARSMDKKQQLNAIKTIDAELARLRAVKKKKELELSIG